MLKRTKSSASASRLLTLLATTLISLPLAGCVTLGSGTSTRYLDTSCEAFKAITYSSRDTPETVSEVRAHNRAYDALCPQETTP